MKLVFDLASNVTSVLDDSGEQVWGLSALPQSRLIPDSIQYFKVDALGLDFMQNTYTAKYETNEGSITAFLSYQDSMDLALHKLRRYEEYGRKYGRGCKLVKKDQIDFLLCDMSGIFDVIFQKGRQVVGVVSVKDQVQALELAIELWHQLSPE